MQVVLLKSHVAQHGGLEKYASRIAQGFLSRGLNVSILTTGKQRDSLHRLRASLSTRSKHAVGPPFGEWNSSTVSSIAICKSIPAALVFGMDRNRYQTHYRAGNGVHAAFLESRRYTESRLKQISFLFNPLHLKILELEKAAFENPALQKLFANSHMVRREILHYYRTDPAKIEVIHNGVEWQEMENDFERVACLQRKSGYRSKTRSERLSFSLHRQWLFAQRARTAHDRPVAAERKRVPSFRHRKRQSLERLCRLWLRN